MDNLGMSEMFNRAQTFIDSMSDEEFADWFKARDLVEDYLAIPDTVIDLAIDIK